MHHAKLEKFLAWLWILCEKWLASRRKRLFELNLNSNTMGGNDVFM